LGIDAPGVKPWARANELPYFLRDAFQFGELELLGQPVVLAIGRAEAKQSLSEVRTCLDKVKALAGQPAVYITDALASYDRRRLIEHKVPFIVPGNQLYLPDLGLDLREYFRRRAPATEVLSPSAQAMLITALLRKPWQSDWQPSKDAVALGYTPMTVSRVVKELHDRPLASAANGTPTGAGLGAGEARTANASQARGLGGSPRGRCTSARPHRGLERTGALLHADRAEMAGVCDDHRRLEGCDGCWGSGVA
jgi:hypothetical protein